MDECKGKSNIIYEVEVGRDRSEKQLYEDTPEAYRVEKANTASGIIVYGRYPGGRWIPNPSCRELIAHLLRSGGHLTQQVVEDGVATPCQFCGCLDPGDVLTCQSCGKALGLPPA